MTAGDATNADVVPLSAPDLAGLRAAAEVIPPKSNVWRVSVRGHDTAIVTGDDLFLTINSYRAMELAFYIAAVSPDVLLSLLDDIERLTAWKTKMQALALSAADRHELLPPMVLFLSFEPPNEQDTARAVELAAKYGWDVKAFQEGVSA